MACVARMEVRDRWRRICSDRTKLGLTERTYDSDGTLKQTRVREDAALLKMQMQAVDPEMYNPEKSTGNNVTIIVQSRKEGGWGSEEAQAPREVGRIEVASVEENETDE